MPKKVIKQEFKGVAKKYLYDALGYLADFEVTSIQIGSRVYRKSGKKVIVERTVKSA